MHMNYWLMKTEPSTYSWDDLVNDKRTSWTGVRNFAARNHLRAMSKDDQVFIYHSMSDKAIVGIAKVISIPYSDPTSVDDWTTVDIAPVKKLLRAVTLTDLKSFPALSEMKLLKIGRLSVSPVTKKEFEAIVKISSI